MGEWLGTRADLAFIIDSLKHVGRLRTSDAGIVNNIDYQSTAKNRAKTLRDTRKKIKDGSSHPDRDLIDRLIEVLSKGLH